MIAARNTGWQFRGAELGGATAERTAPGGLALTPAGRAAMISGDAAVRQAIVLLLTTMPGERVMRPDYGCPLNRLMFLPNDATTAGLAIHYVRQALIRFEPRVDIVSLDASAGGRTIPGEGPAAPEDDGVLIALNEAATLLISLVYRVRASQRVQSLEFELGLDGGGAR